MIIGGTPYERISRVRFAQKNEVQIGGRFVRKVLILVVCVGIVVVLSSIDPGGWSEESYGHWDWSGVDMDAWMGNMSQTMANRRQHLRKACAETGLDKKGNDSLHQPNSWEFLINRKHHLVWCNVFKAASTSWMYNFNILAGYSPKFLQTTKQVPLQLARTRYPRPSVEALIKAQNHNSTTFIIVRHPLERLLSGYRDKIEHAIAHTYHKKLNNYIIQHYRKPNRGKKTNRNTPTFSEFVDYVVDVYKEGTPLDMHWAPINTFCTPCQIHFDIIMKFETLEEDQNYLIHSQGLEKWIKPQWKNPSKGRSRTTKLINKYYSQLTSQQLTQLSEIYKYDMHLFNYTLDDVKIDH